MPNVTNEEWKSSQIDSDYPQEELPRYKSHKEVWALKIRDLTQTSTGLLLIPEESGYLPFILDQGYVAKHNPKIGGYYVLYKDGYKSWSPADAFEEGYTKIN